MSAIPGLGLSIPIAPNTNAHADDLGQSSLNTPVNVVAGNGAGNIAQILEGLSGLNAVENQPANKVLSSGALGGISPWLLIGGGLLLLLLLRRRDSHAT